MGGHGYEVESGLYGLKGDLLEGFREGSVPRWLAPDNPSLGGSTAIRPSKLSGEEFLSAWIDRAKERGESMSVGFAVKGAPNTQVKHEGMVIAGRQSRHATPEAPEKVLERCREHVDTEAFREHKAAIDNRTGRFTGFYVNVEIGARGGIQDTHLSSDFKQ